MIRRLVKIPVDEWRTVKGALVKDVSTVHKLLFVAQHDSAEVNQLKKISDAVSYPNSAAYGKFMKYDEIYRSVLPTTTKNGRILEEWAKANGLRVTGTTANKQHIMVEASIETVERVFQTKLQQYKHVKTGKIVLRGTSFVLPSDIDKRVAVLGGLGYFPHIRETKKKVSDVAQASTNAPIIYLVSSGFGFYQFYVQLVCYNGQAASNSLCANQFGGFQINLSKQSKTYTISVAQSNCQVCSRASSQTADTCKSLGLKMSDVLCLFYLNQTDSVPLYEPHTFTMRTKLSTKLTTTAVYSVATEKVTDATPPVLRSLYNVDDSTNTTRDNRSRQAVIGFQQYLDMAAFNSFAKLFGKDFKLLFGKVYGDGYDNSTADSTETSLDVQYMAAMGSRIPMDYISPATIYDGFLIDSFIQLALLQEDKENMVPLVYSISYAVSENQVPAEYIEACEIQFLIMSVTGKTVFAASGDDGSTSHGGKCLDTFVPNYPASSAYVTSVGATQFLKSSGDCSRKLNGYCLQEVTASTSSLTSCAITSGGGFSNVIESPPYQSAAVQTYLRNSTNQLPPDTYYNRSNRAYPDISLVGHHYLIKMFGNSNAFVDGTSASSPAVAGLFSLIINRRLTLGMPPLGFLNPLLYNLPVTQPAFFYDITQGNTKCNTSPFCCRYGFVTAKGWDPVTGFGSINHRALMNELTQM